MSTPLEGPPNDVESLAEALVADWGFAPWEIEKLVGATASRAHVLEALDRMVERTRPGDHVLIYFSGHGISGHDHRSGRGMDWTCGPGPSFRRISSAMQGRASWAS